MEDFDTSRVALSTGVTLNVALAGPPGGEPVILLHGFPESHRTWRNQLRDLAGGYRLIAPDQRGYGGSDLPEGVENYTTDKTIADIFALADALEVERFTLVGHDWGGAIAWMAALTRPDRVKRLVIVNAPHPLLFQKSVIENPEQRAASQYVRHFRETSIEKMIETLGLQWLLERVFENQVSGIELPDEEREAYVRDWSRPGALTAMLNWYRASQLEVPKEDEEAQLPPWTEAPFPPVRQPTLLIWGMQDKALLPVQLEGLHALVDDLRLVLEPEAGHFITWERPEVVTNAIRDFMAEGLD